MRFSASTSILVGALVSSTSALPSHIRKEIHSRQDPGTALLSVNGSEGVVNGEVILHQLTVNSALPSKVWGVTLLSSQGGNISTANVACHAFSDTEGVYGWGDTFTLNVYEDWPEFSNTYGPAQIGSYLCGSLAEINAWFAS